MKSDNESKVEIKSQSESEKCQWKCEWKLTSESENGRKLFNKVMCLSK